MKKMISVLLTAAILISSFAFTASALTADESKALFDAAYAEMFGSVAGDVNNDGVLTAADARDALLCSAGLEKEGINKSRADVDGDGIVTAIDARTILRASAKLEPVNALYSGESKLNFFNAVINSIKPNRYRFYRSIRDYTDNIYFNDSSAIDKLISDMSVAKILNPLLWTMSNDEIKAIKSDFTKGIGEIDYSGNSSLLRSYTASNMEYPISGNDFGSLLTMDDIAGIEYNVGQTFEYNNYRRTTNGTPDINKTVKLRNLDTITVHIKTDALKSAPKDPFTTSNGKIFDILTQKDVDAILGADNVLDGIINDGMGMIGELSLKQSLESLKYYDSYITVYMDPDTKAPVAASYNLHYDFTLRSHLKVDIPIAPVTVDGDFVITTTMTSTTDYYFEANAEAGNDLIG